MMKNTQKLWFLIAVIAMIGLAVMGCAGPDDSGTTTPAHTHTAGAAATCTTPQTCTGTECDYVFAIALEHDFNLIQGMATCTVSGTGRDHCLRDGCDYSESAGTYYNPLGHHFTSLTDAGCHRPDCSDEITLADYLASPPAGYTGTGSDKPVPIKISIDLGDMGTSSNWRRAETGILAVLNTSGKLVALDLSGSYRSSDGAFTTGSASNTAAPGLAGLRQIVSIVLPETTVTSIGMNAFRNCTSLTNITIPNSVTSISSNAFYNCIGLTSVTIPNSVTTIGDTAFQGCTGLTSITIPASVTSIGSSAFRNCAGLTSVIIPSSVTSIGSYAFTDSGIWNAAPNDSVFYVDKWALGYKGTPSSSVNIQEGTVGIGGFNGVADLTNIDIPNSVRYIGIDAFRNCTNLTSVTIPNSVSSIGTTAFSGCRSLTSITIGSGVISIGANAFYFGGADDPPSSGGTTYGPCALTSFTILKETPPSLGAGNLLREMRRKIDQNSAMSLMDTRIESLTIFVPAGSVNAYKAATNWSAHANMIQAIQE